MKKIISVLILSIGVLNTGLLPEKQIATEGISGLVELRIYSGRKNPTWLLSEEDAEVIFNKLANLAHSPTKKLDDGLGYIGFRVSKIGTLSKLPEEFYIYERIAFDGVRYYEDRNRQLEMWILRSGKQHLDSKLYADLEREILSSRK